MSKKLGLLIALVGLCALSLFLLSCGSSSSRPSGLLYVLTEGTNGVGNNVTSFAIDLSSGNLSLINSNASTCTTSGVDCGPPLDIVLDPTGATAFVLNQGIPSSGIAPTIYGYPINSDGSFGAPTVAATLTSGDLAVAMTRDPAGQYLYVIDQGASPDAVSCGAPPNVVNINCASISVFTVQSGSSTLTPVAGSPFALGRLPTALSVLPVTAPANPNLPCAATSELLFVTFNSDPALHDDNTLSAYCVDSSGKPNDLTPTLPYATTTDPLTVQAVNTNPAGQTDGGLFVYVGTQPVAAGALNIFQVCTSIGPQGCSAQDVANFALKPVTTPPPPTPGAKPVAMLVDPTNTFLYVACENSSQVFGYKINATSGVLSALTPTTSQPTGSHPVALALHPSVNSSGAFLYTSNSVSSNISGFSVSTTTGSMGSPITVNSPSTPSGMAAR